MLPHRTRVLFVDDEPTIRLTLPKILEMHEFDVKAAATVQDALKLIQQERFDVLLSDLNIGEPSDGFTVVSAMRRCQPDAITIILTGYPAFESALQALREQVDDYISKPAKVEDLIKKIKDKVQNHTRRVLAPLRKVHQVLEANRGQIVSTYLGEMRAGKFPVAGLSDAEVRNNMPKMLDEIIRNIATNDNGKFGNSVDAAKEHGRLRHTQGFAVHHLIEESRLLRHIICGMIQQNMLALDASTVVPDLVRIGDCIDARLIPAVDAYLASEASLRKRTKQQVRQAS